MEYQEVNPGAPREEPGSSRNIPERREIRDIREVRPVARAVAPAQVFLQPIASPWGLGLLSLSITTFVIGAFMARWYGAATTPVLMLPFVLMVGGLTTLLASMWMFRARDVLGTVALGIWGAFWLGYGLFYYWASRGVYAGNLGAFPEFGWFFFALAAVTLSATIAATAENWGVTLTLASLTAAAILMGIAQLVLLPALTLVAGYLFLLSALAGWYTGTALMLESSMNRAVLPLQAVMHPEEEPDINEGVGEPGVVRHHHPGHGYSHVERTGT